MKKNNLLLILTLVFAISLTSCVRKAENSIATDDISNSSTETLGKEPETNNMYDISKENELAEDDRMTQMQTATLQYPSQNDEWKYNVYNCYIELTKYIGPAVSQLIIPDEIEGLPVWSLNANGGEDWHGYDTGIGSSWSNKGTKLQSVLLPDCLLVLGASAFDYSGIQEINLPDGLVIIEESALQDNDFTSIYLPDSLQTIGDSAFRGCDKLTNIEIPENVLTIGEHAFLECDSISEITIPKSVKSIGDAAFQGGYESDDIKITILNPDTQLGDILYAAGNWKGTICGYAGSTAAQYCSEHNDCLTFEVIK